MKCEEFRELLLEFSLGQLDSGRMNEVREHLDEGCGVCAKDLSEIVEAWSRLATNLEPVKPSPEVEARLLAMIRGEITTTHEPFNRQSLARPAVADRKFRILVLAATLLGVVAGAVSWSFTPLGSTLARLKPAAPPQETWGLRSPDGAPSGFQTVSLEPVAESKVHVNVVVNQLTDEWHVLGSGLPRVEGTDIVRLWFESKSGKFRGITLPVDESGHVGAIVELSDTERADVAGMWLTTEDVANGQRPSDHVLFHASVK